MDVTIGVLGPLRARRGGRDVELGRAAWRRVLLLLALHEGRLTSDDALVTALWEAPPDSAVATLRTHVSHLRRRLGADVVVREGGGYRLVVADDALDARRFVRLVREGRLRLQDGAPAAAGAVLDEALGLWRGPAYAELADVLEAQPEIRRLDELRAAAAEDRVEARIAMGAADQAVAEARALVETAPFRERSWQLLLRALAAVGRQEEAIAAFQQIRARLVDELGIEPGAALQEEHARVLRQEVAPATSTGTAADGVPDRGVPLPEPLDRFVGRRALRDSILSRLADHRLVTLVGPGGSGKTRLAVEAARRSDGPVRFADLAALDDGEQVGAAIAAAVVASPRPGLSVAEAVAVACADQPLLLVVDNAEHVVDAVAALAPELLATAGGLRLLVTSRAPLEVAGEERLPVPPMDLGADPDHPQAAAARAAVPGEAVELFLDRAEAVGVGLGDDPAELRTVRRICARLDGMPLAIELAAARLAHLPLEELDARLEDRFGLLVRRRGDERHRTLRTAVDWSHDLLDEAERRLFRRLGAFAASFPLDAASALLGADALASLSALVDQSLVLIDRSATTARRYRLLETLRVYALERLRDAGEEEDVRERHLRWVVGWAARFRGEEGWPSDPAVLAEVRATLPEASAAMAWAQRRGRHVDVLEIAASLVMWWQTLGYVDGPRRRLETSLAGAADVDADLRMRALQTAAWMAGSHSDYPRASDAAREVEVLATDLGAHRWRSWAVETQANAAWNTGDWDRAMQLYERALPLIRNLGDTVGEAEILQCIAAVAYRRGEYRRAGRLLEEAASLYTAGGADFPVWARYDLGILANRLGDYRTAAEHLTATLRHAEAFGEEMSIGASLRDLARVAVNEGRVEEGRQLARRSIAHHRYVGDRWGEAASLQVHAWAALLLGDAQAAAQDAAAGLALFEQLGDAWGAAGCRVVAGRAAAASGASPDDRERGLAALRTAEAHARRLGDPWLVAEALDGLAELLPTEEAAAALGEAEALRERIGAPLPPGEQRSADARVERLRGALGDPTFGAQREAGRVRGRRGRFRARTQGTASTPSSRTEDR